MKYLIFLLIITSFPVSAQVAENNPSKVWVIINYIKDNAKADYEKWMTDIFFKPMNNTKDPVLAQQNASTRWLSPARQNPDKTWTYVFLMDPIIPKADYDIENYLQHTYGEAQGKTYMKQYESFIASEPQVHVLNNDRIESAQNRDEEAIKKVITTEFDAYVQRDFKTWADSYVDAPTTTFMVTDANTSGSLFAMSDFQKISKGMKVMFDSGSKSTMSLANRDGWLIGVKGDMAFAIYNEEFLLANGTKIKGKTQKVMEKVNGQWKIATTSAICDFNNAVIPTPNPEEEAIKKVIIDETGFWIDGNFDKWSESFVREPYLTWSVTNGGEPGDVITTRGWEALRGFMEGWFKNYNREFANKMRKSDVSRDNWNIQVRVNVAYVSFNQHTVNQETKQVMDMTETRVLEKKNGTWKVAMQTTLADFKDATPTIRSKY